MSALAAQLAIPHDILRWEHPPLSGNLQAEARAARQRLIGGWAADRGLAGVLLGHTRDDQAETVLLRLARGTGLDGLAAMAERTELAGTRWLRPMLSVDRQSLRKLLTARGIGWAEDPSNEDTRFDRVRARRALDALVPLGLTAERLAETAGRLAEDRVVLAGLVGDLTAKGRRWGAFGEAWLDPRALANAPRTLAARMLGDILRRISGCCYPPRRRSIDGLLDRLEMADFPGATLSGCVLRRRSGQLLLYREAAAQEHRLTAADGVVWDRRWRISLECDRGNGSEVGALGAAGLVALRDVDWEGPQDWATAPAALRQTVPALWQGDTLLAVPHAAYPPEASPIRALSDLATADTGQTAREHRKLAP